MRRGEAVGAANWALILLGISCTRNGDFEEAFLVAHEARKLMRKSGDPAGRISAYNLLANVYGGLGQYKWARIYLNEGLALLRKHPMPRQELLLQRGLSWVPSSWSSLRC